MLNNEINPQKKSITSPLNDNERTIYGFQDFSVHLLVMIFRFCSFFETDFEINIVVVFADDHLVTENFPLKLTRF